MVRIVVNNIKCQVIGTMRDIHDLRQKFRIRNPGAWYSQAYRTRQWDGFNYYITEAGYFSTGLLPKVCTWLKEEKRKYKLDDSREGFIFDKAVLKWDKIELRDYQAESVKAVLSNQFEGVVFTRGILDEATNAGKSMIAASLFKSFPKDKKFIFIVNRQHLYKQLKSELGQSVGWLNMGFIGPDEFKLNRFMICMAQTLAKNYHKYSELLSQFDVCFIDECHYASSNTYKDILFSLGNCYVRIGLSGTPFKHKDKNKNEKILSFFGPTLHKTSNANLIDLGFSTKPIVTILPGNTRVKCLGDYKREERKGLTHSKERNKAVLARVKRHIKKDRYPILVICKYHDHTELIYKRVKKAFPDYSVNYIHVKVKDRLKRLESFREGKIDILVSSKLIKEGQNLPLIKSLVLACGGDSVIDTLQLVGRALRKHKSKKRVYIDDFFDEGAYLKRHSKHRVKVYKEEKFKILDKTK